MTPPACPTAVTVVAATAIGRVVRVVAAAEDGVADLDHAAADRRFADARSEMLIAYN